MRIVIGGQMEKEKILHTIEEFGDPAIEAVIKGDIEAARMVKKGEADYYFGCCATGGGGSLAAAIAILGYSKCASVSMPGRPPKEQEIVEQLDLGKVAFGFTDNHVSMTIPLLLKSIKNRK
jgi:hypothetical protein